MFLWFIGEKIKNKNKNRKWGGQLCYVTVGVEFRLVLRGVTRGGGRPEEQQNWCYITVE